MAIYEEPDVAFFDRRKISEPAKMLSSHYHDMNEIYFLEKGKTTYFVKNELYFLTPGDMIFVPRWTIHQTNNEDSSNMERILLTFDDSFVGEEFIPYLDEIRKDRHIRISPEHIHVIRSIFNMIEQENMAKCSDSIKVQQLYLRQLLVMINRYRVSRDEPRLDEISLIIQKAAKYIYENPANDLSLNNLSKRYAMSPCHFSRQFKRITGINLSEYININRISYAERLLSSTNMTVTQVSEKCGFDNSNYFAAVFKKLKGTSPKRYSMNIKKAGISK